MKSHAIIFFVKKGINMTIAALQSFAKDRTQLLIVSDTGELSAVDRATVSCWTLFLARLGFGSAALCNVHVSVQLFLVQNDCTPDALDKETGNAIGVLNSKIRHHNERCLFRSQLSEFCRPRQ